MRIVVADCEVHYSGRGQTWLPRAKRLLMHKDDGSIGVHGFTGVKPLNYMGAGAVFSESEDTWSFDLRQENITITLYEIYSDVTTEPVGSEPGLQRDGTEAHLQEWLSQNLSEIDGYLTFIEREHETGAGPVDLLALNEATGNNVLIEVKRVATTAAVHQVRRYGEAYAGNPELVICAFDIRPKAQALCEKHDIAQLVLPVSVREKLGIKISDKEKIELA